LLFIGTDFVGLPRNEHYRMNYTHENGTSVTEICQILNDTCLSCRSPFFEKNGTISLSLGVNSEQDYIPLTSVSLQLVRKETINFSYSFKNPILRVSDTPTTIIVENINLFSNVDLASQSSNEIHLFDSNFIFAIPLTPYLSNTGKILLNGTVPALWDYKLDFPRIFSVSYLFDGKTEIIGAKLTIEGLFENYTSESNLKLKSLYPLNVFCLIEIINFPFQYLDTKLILTSVSHNITFTSQNRLFYSSTPLNSGNYTVQIYHEIAKKIVPLKFPSVSGFSLIYSFDFSEFPTLGYKFYSYKFLNGAWNYLIGVNTEFTKGDGSLKIASKFQNFANQHLNLTHPLVVINDTHIRFQMTSPDLQIYQYVETYLCFVYTSFDDYCFKIVVESSPSLFAIIPVEFISKI
jgi:hypothetical protein